MVVTFIPQDCARNGFGARDPRRLSLFGLDESLHLGGVAKADVAESRFRPACSPTPAAHHTTSPTVATSTSTATVSTSNSILATSPGVTTSPYGGLDAIPRRRRWAQERKLSGEPDLPIRLSAYEHCPGETGVGSSAVHT